MVGDFPYWLEQVSTWPFSDYIHGKGFSKSMCEFTQLNTYILYKTIGINKWAWHIVFISLHSISALLLYVLLSNIFRDAEIKNRKSLAFTSAILFIVTPMASEAVVWKPAYHFLLATIFILTVLILVQKYQRTPQNKYAIYAGVIYLISTFSLELFYVTPLLCLALSVFYFKTFGNHTNIFKKTITYFWVPQIICVLFNLFLLKALHHSFISHYSNIPDLHIIDLASKPLKYLFHILFFGRFLPNTFRFSIYEFCESLLTLIVFYASLTGVLVWILATIKRRSGYAKTILLLSVFIMIILVYLSPLAFPNLLLVTYDRYSYLVSGFVFAMVVLLLNSLRSDIIKYSLVGLYITANIFFTLKVNGDWLASQKIINSLYKTFPAVGNKVVIQLNVPQCFDGVPMMDAQTSPDGGFKLMYNEFSGNHINSDVYGVAAFNMISSGDGAHITVINDSVVNVTLNQWGTWWWFSGLGAFSYENEQFKVNMRDVGHEYQLVLKKPEDKYVVMFEADGKWKIVNWNKKNVAQY